MQSAASQPRILNELLTKYQNKSELPKMRLTTYTDYALRVLIYAALQGERLSTIAEISDSYGISKNHLMKIVHELGMGGYLQTVRGKRGGIRLAQKPEQINIGEVVRYCEQDSALVECYERGGGNCCIRKACILRQALDKALKAFLNELDRYSLADLAAPGRQLAHALEFAYPVETGAIKQGAAGHV